MYLYDMCIESLAVQTDVLELKAPVTGYAEATVLDACMEKGRGVVVNALVTWGSIAIGDAVVVGTSHGKVKVCIDHFIYSMYIHSVCSQYSMYSVFIVYVVRVYHIIYNQY